MSGHLEDSQLLRLLSSGLEGAPRESLDAHLSECDACRARFDALRATWDLLGEWSVEAPARDLSGSVVAQARRGQRRWSEWRELGQIAAAVAIAVLGGSAAGRLAPLPARHPGASTETSAEEVRDALGLEALSQTAILSNVFELEALPSSIEEEEAQS